MSITIYPLHYLLYASDWTGHDRIVWGGFLAAAVGMLAYAFKLLAQELEGRDGPGRPRAWG
ncbi:MAG: hypothetical protein KDA24_00970 [Deltaproteobacteria bacterium]|nr:hypothetical protein [Deltaproteobacteria bacterium]